MKVCELIELLKTMPQNLAVMVEGGDYGVQEEFEATVKKVDINRNHSDGSYGDMGGPHEVVDELMTTRGTVVDALVFER